MAYNPFDLYAKLDYKPHWTARVKWFFKRRKYVRERARQGWSSYDVWDFDTYLAQLIGGAMEFLAQNNMSRPWEYTDEEWKEKLLHISECFKQYNIDQPCPSYSAWRASVEREESENGCVTVSGGDPELARAWHEEELHNYNEKMKKLKEGFDLLYEVYSNLWD